ncbi:pentapeptide repeat-containing protein [Paenibacillus mesotrionivorans]|uniref:Pentapeptide repeat-containing protein n=1 Tax=Paenibacillus mesotrionivorans TaxID=3160968 RepID=A0ACC7NYQ1_9BACL
MLSKTDLNKLDVINKMVLVEQELNDQFQLEDKTIQNSSLLSLGLNRAKFINSRITQTIVQDCYLRNATFQNVDLTGTKFINCNLEKASFRVCNLRYTEFSKCKINLQEILSNLPTESNLKINILKQLLINQTEMSEKKSCDKLNVLIAEEERVNSKNKFLCLNSYYSNIGTLDRVNSFFSYIMQTISGFVWGYGLSLWKLFRFAVLTVIFFAVIISFLDLEYIDKINNNKVSSLEIHNALFLSFLVFSGSGYGEFLPNGFMSTITFVIESGLGIIFLGFFVSAVYRRIAR